MSPWLVYLLVGSGAVLAAGARDGYLRRERASTGPLTWRSKAAATVAAGSFVSLGFGLFLTSTGVAEAMGTIGPAFLLAAVVFSAIPVAAFFLTLGLSASKVTFELRPPARGEARSGRLVVLMSGSLLGLQLALVGSLAKTERQRVVARSSGDQSKLEALLQQALSRKDVHLLKALALNPSSSPALLQEIASADWAGSHRSEGFRDLLQRDFRPVPDIVALHPRTSISTLDELSESPSAAVRASVARNPNTRPETLAELLRDELEGVRVPAAKNLSTPIEALERAQRDLSLKHVLAPILERRRAAESAEGPHR